MNKYIMNIFLKVPYHQKDIVRQAGAKWSPGYKKWYIEDVVDLLPFMTWIDPRLKVPHVR